MMGKREKKIEFMGEIYILFDSLVYKRMKL